MVSKSSLITLIKYFSVSIAVYLLILGGMYWLVDWLKLGKIESYLIVYLCAYVTEYVVTLKFVFHSNHQSLKVFKFIVHTSISIILGTFFYDGLLGINVNYLLATFLTALILLPLRFFSNKYFVYR